MGKVIPLRPTEHEPSAKEALENIGEAFEKFCGAVTFDDGFCSRGKRRDDGD